MAFPFAALIGAGASIGGGLLQSAGTAAQNQAQRDIAENANVASAERAYAAQQFSEYMSNTAYQRSMADMQKAGLNPILAYQQGGASTPQGSVAQVFQAQLENEMEGLGEGVSSAAQRAKDAEASELAREQTSSTKSQTELNKANEGLAKTMEEKAKVDTLTSAKQTERLEAEKNLADQQTKNAMIQAGVLSHNVTSAAGEARIKSAEADNAERFGPGPWGNLGATGERFGRRLLDAFKGVKPQSGPHSAGWLDELLKPRGWKIW